MENAGFTGRLEAVIEQCLSPQKEKRFQTAKELLEALGALRTGVFTENQMPLLTIAVAGSRPARNYSCGLALSAFLNLQCRPLPLRGEKFFGGSGVTGTSYGKAA